MSIASLHSAVSSFLSGRAEMHARHANDRREQDGDDDWGRSSGWRGENGHGDAHWRNGDGVRPSHTPDAEAPGRGADSTNVPTPGDGHTHSARHADGDHVDNGHWRPPTGDVPAGPRNADSPAIPHLEDAVAHLMRELRSLPPDVVRQLDHVFNTEPGRLREMPASAQALAELVGRAIPQGADAGKPVHGDARLPPGPSAETPATPLEMRGEQRLPAEVRMIASALATQAGERAHDEAGNQALLAQQATLPARAEAALTTPAQTASNAPADASLAQQTTPSWAPGEGTPLQPARADGNPFAADRGGGPGLPGGTSVAAAGVTLAAVANPAGTTHAYAPDSAVRARKPGRERKEARDQHKRNDARGSNGDGARDGQRGKHSGARAAGQAGAGSASAVGGAATAGSAMTSGAAANAAGHATAAGPQTRHARGTPAGNPAAAAIAWEDPEFARSRHRQWLYWSLIVVTYGCLASALALVSPDWLGLTISAESATTARKALTAAGLLAGLWAWLLARRMR